MKHRNHARKSSAEVHLGFQIAPMIDVVFVILLYFMIAAGDIQAEKAHVTKLPGDRQEDQNQPSSDEIILRIEDDGQVYLNDDPVDAPETRALPELLSSLKDLRASTEAANTKLFVTISANESAEYQRVIDVLDVLTRAKISNVTFQAGAPD
jgi:biopolymer transport protein ExbD